MTVTMKRVIRIFLSWPLRIHLMLLALLLTLPALSLIVYSGLDERKNALNAGVQETKMLVNSISAEQYNLTGDAEQLASVLALLPDVRLHNTAAVDAILADILKKNSQYSNVVICDRRGSVWASALPLTRNVSLRGDALFLKALKTRHFSSGEFTVGRISGIPNLGFGYPVPDARGEIDCVISVNVNFVYLNNLLVQAGLPDGSLFTLADRKGVVIYRNLDSRSMAGTQLASSVFRRMASQTDGINFLDFGTAEKGMISSFGTLRLKGENSPYLYILAGIPMEETFSRARHAQFFQVALLSPFLLIALTLAILIGKVCFVNPIGRLQRASERLARGERGVRVSDYPIGREFRALGKSFDEMALQLALRESELNALNQGLELQVKEETERRLQHERLLARHARLAAIGEMIGAIAHQWRQPLATLGATVQSLRVAWERRRLDGAFLARAEAAAQKQLNYMSETIEDFRNFFSPEKVAECFEVREKIAEVALLVSAQFTNAGVALEVADATAGGELRICGYPNEFKQSVLNLVSNAFDAVVARYGAGSPRGACAGSVVVGVERSGDGVVIEVRDNGCGIPAEYAEKVYEPYFTSKPQGKGTGIGLYMSKLIVEESMGGRLSFTSSQEGTVFRIELARSGAGGGGQMDDLVRLKVLYVEDEPDLRDRIRIVLEMYYQTVLCCGNGSEGAALFDVERPDVVVSDIMMPVADGLEMTRRIREMDPETPIIFTTAFTETSYLLKAIELGVSAYVRKPLEIRELVAAIDRAAAPILLRRELEAALAGEQSSLELMLGESPVMRQTVQQARRIASTDFSLIVQGETGTGKSKLAFLIHNLSRRRESPFVTVTLSSLAETLVESQLFGHVKGAFTGALAARRGLFEEAGGGTLFLDDLDCASPAIQAKLLEAVELKGFFPVGGTKRVQVDCRIIAASNRDLLAEVAKGSFREDLYYRLADLVITLPPLREREGDIALLARLFLNEVSLELERVPPRLTSDALLLLSRHPWPGNLRQLKSVMKRAALFAGETLTGEELAQIFGSLNRGVPGQESTAVPTLDQLKHQAVLQALAATGGKKMEAARLLDVEYGRFKRLLDRYRL